MPKFKAKDCKQYMSIDNHLEWVTDGGKVFDIKTMKDMRLEKFMKIPRKLETHVSYRDLKLGRR